MNRFPGIPQWKTCPTRCGGGRCGGRGSIVAAALALTVASGGAAPASAGGSGGGTVLGAGSPDAVRGSYIVTVDPSVPTDRGGRLLGRYGGRVEHTFTRVLNGWAAELTAGQAARLAADPAVDRVYQSRRFVTAGEQDDPPSWGLDRMDQRHLPLDASYGYPDRAGHGVTVYVVDTGVRISHADLRGRARYGYDAVDGDRTAADGHGHGTHVATIAAGKTYGVAKRADVVAVRVLDDRGAGTTAQIVAGLDWVTRHADGPSVVNLSLGGRPDAALDRAVRNTVAAGLTVTVAAGNTGRRAGRTSPARVPEAITVGAVRKDDTRAWYSNYGPALDLFAPGSRITGGWGASDRAAVTLSGTSMAAPHAAGAAALHLSGRTGDTPRQVAAALRAAATPQAVRRPGTGSPRRLLYVAPPP